MILRLQSVEELELLQSRIKAKAKSTKVHINELRTNTGTDICYDPCGMCGRVYSNEPSYKENAAKLAAQCPNQDCVLRVAAPDASKTLQDAQEAHSESELMRAVRWYLQNHPSVAWAERINAGGSRRNGSYVKYGFPGISDFIGMLKTGQFLAIECKTKGGRLSPDQAAFLARVEMWKGVSGVVRSIEDLKVLLPTDSS